MIVVGKEDGDRPSPTNEPTDRLTEYEIYVVWWKSSPSHLPDFLPLYDFTYIHP